LGSRLGSPPAPRLVCAAVVVSDAPCGSTRPPPCTGLLLQYPILHQVLIFSVLTDVGAFGCSQLGSGTRCLRTSRRITTVRYFGVFQPPHGCPCFRRLTRLFVFSPVHTAFRVTRISVFSCLPVDTRKFVFFRITRHSVPYGISCFLEHTELRITRVSVASCFWRHMGFRITRHSVSPCFCPSTNL
jgi:hypothetical protein